MPMTETTWTMTTGWYHSQPKTNHLWSNKTSFWSLISWEQLQNLPIWASMLIKCMKLDHHTFYLTKLKRKSFGSITSAGYYLFINPCRFHKNPPSSVWEKKYAKEWQIHGKKKLRGGLPDHSPVYIGVGMVTNTKYDYHRNFNRMFKGC